MSRAYLKRGFSILEAIAVVGMAITLTSVSVVAYNNYVANARKSDMKNDLATIHKSYQVFSSHSGNYCYDEQVRYREPEKVCDSIASLYNVGVGYLLANEKYGANAKKRPNFIGFAQHSCDDLDLDRDGTPEAVLPNNDNNEVYVSALPADNTGDCTVTTNIGRRAILGLGAQKSGDFPNRDTSCLLDENKYKLGVFGFFKGKTWIGMNMNHNGFTHERIDINGGAIPTNVHLDYTAGNGEENAPCASP